MMRRRMLTWTGAGVLLLFGISGITFARGNPPEPPVHVAPQHKPPRPAGDPVATGTVVAVSGHALTVMELGPHGKQETFDVSSAAVVKGPGVKGSSSLSLSAIRTGDQVAVTKANGHLVVHLLPKPPVPAVVVRVSSGIIVLRESAPGHQTKTVDVARSSVTTLSPGPGAQASSTSLTAGEHVMVQPTAHGVALQMAPTPPVQGVIVAVSSRSLTMRVMGAPGQASGDKTYQLGSGTTVVTRPGHTTSLSRLRVGDHVGVTRQGQSLVITIMPTPPRPPR